MKLVGILTSAEMSDLLNKDCWDNIVSYLEARNICSLSLTGKYLYSICNEEKVWKCLIFRDFIFPTSPSLVSFKQLYIHQHKQEKILTSKANIFKFFISDDENISEKDGKIYVYGPDYKESKRGLIQSLNRRFKDIPIKRGDGAFYESEKETKNFFYYNGKYFKNFYFSQDDQDYAPYGRLTIYKFPINYWKILPTWYFLILPLS